MFLKTTQVLQKTYQKSPIIRSFKIYSKLSNTLSIDNINPNLKSMEYGVRGFISQKANQIEKELLRGVEKPFKQVVHLNIDDAQSLGQPPITFVRQLLALVSYPILLSDKRFPEDVKVRAKAILSACPGGSIGSYSDVCGMEFIREHIAQFIEERDHCPSDWKNCCMGHGALDMAKKFLNLLRIEIDGKPPGIMNPVPEYPFYSSTIAELGMERVDYHLKENGNWYINVEELKKSIAAAKTRCNPRAIVVINPGNPTGQVLCKENMEQVIKFAYDENLILICDEVFQDIILQNDRHFISFKRVLNDMGSPYNKLELVSLMSVSKGHVAESGIKAGYAELSNIDGDVRSNFIKSIGPLLPSTLAQTALYALTNPPKPNDPSYEQFDYERNSIMGAIKISATIAEESFNSLYGVSCNVVESAIFAFPEIRLPKEIVEISTKLGISADQFYALQLLNETGICVVPGSGFGRIPDKYHIRMTLFPNPNYFHKLMERYKKFHHKFMKTYMD